MCAPSNLAADSFYPKSILELAYTLIISILNVGSRIYIQEFIFIFILKKNLLYHPTNLLRLAVLTKTKEFYKIPIFYDHEFLKE
jgi:hypothetical protein